MKANYRARCARTNNALTKAYGVPVWPGPADPLELLVKALLSRMTTAKGVGQAWTALRKAYPTWEAMIDSKPETAVKALKRGSLAVTKAKVLVKVIQQVRREFGTPNLDFIRSMSVREAMRALGTLEGVDQETGAGVILFALGREVVPVDKGIHRVLTRMGIIINSSGPEHAFNVLQPLVPRGQSFPFYMNLVRLAREVCRVSRPKCAVCPVESECRYPAKNLSRTGRR